MVMQSAFCRSVHLLGAVNIRYYLHDKHIWAHTQARAHTHTHKQDIVNSRCALHSLVCVYDTSHSQRKILMLSLKSSFWLIFASLSLKKRATHFAYFHWKYIIALSAAFCHVQHLSPRPPLFLSLILFLLPYIPTLIWSSQTSCLTPVILSGQMATHTHTFSLSLFDTHLLHICSLCDPDHPETHVASHFLLSETWISKPAPH